ncbi:MAG: glycosyltransferase [Balneolaceae bacterium]|nr:MAG: glycosyltransferase [Balneolaceae bacterium]
MKQPVQLSVILTNHGDPIHFNSLLSDLLRFENGRFEVIIIQDGSDTVLSKFIDSEIKKSSNERVFLYEHSRPLGRGSSLNEGLMHAEGAYIWAPLRAERLNESLLLEAMQRFKSDPAAFWSLDYHLPKQLPDWISAAEEGDLPDDSCLLWNRNIIQQEYLFFNPFMESLHGAELAMRIAMDHSWVLTDPFFVVAEDQSPVAQIGDMKELIFSALRMTEEKTITEQLISAFQSAEQYLKKREADDLTLYQARQLLTDNNANKSLELVNRYLKRNPENPEALRIKIASLEKMRRHVEAAELKHRLFKRAKSEAHATEEKVSDSETLTADSPVETQSGSAGLISQNLSVEEPQFEDETTDAHEGINGDEAAETVEIEGLEPEMAESLVSVVIPVTAHGKSLLEEALIHLDRSKGRHTLELIVVDNASLDDTFDYLEQLTQKKFLNIKVIVNQVNKGVPAAWNQAFELAKGDYILFMHNDVHLKPESIDHLVEALRKSEEAVMAVPVLNNTEYAPQLAGKQVEGADSEVETADSCCFMVEGGISFRFDEEFRPCFYEMEDYCRQIRTAGRKIIVEKKAHADHRGGGSTVAMALHLDPEELWKNRARFRMKWFPGRTAVIPQEGNHAERFRRLGAPLNPLQPDSDWLNRVRDYLTSEVRTEILRGSWNEEELFTIMLTLLIADERELLRTLEERIEGLKPDPALLKLFILYYYRKNIFSRCRHYVGMAEEEDPEFDLFNLRMLIAEKEYDRAIPLLNDLLAHYPSSPELYSHAAEIYKQNQEMAEAESFYAMAHQLHPVKYRHYSGGFSLNV